MNTTRNLMTFRCEYHLLLTRTHLRRLVTTPLGSELPARRRRLAPSVASTPPSGAAHEGRVERVRREDLVSHLCRLVTEPAIRPVAKVGSGTPRW